MPCLDYPTLTPRYREVPVSPNDVAVMRYGIVLRRDPGNFAAVRRFSYIDRQGGGRMVVGFMLLLAGAGILGLIASTRVFEP
jgi:hypothetical protein